MLAPVLTTAEIHEVEAIVRQNNEVERLMKAKPNAHIVRPSYLEWAKAKGYTK